MEQQLIHLKKKFNKFYQLIMLSEDRLLTYFLFKGYKMFTFFYQI